MNVRSLKRDAVYVNSTFERVGDTLITKTGCRIHVPTHYEETKLLEIGTETYTLGVFPIIVGDFFATNIAITMMRIEPTTMTKVEIEGMEFYEFYFESGAVFLANINVVVSAVTAYYAYNDIVAKVRVPWYLSYAIPVSADKPHVLISDMARLFLLSEKYAGIRVGATKTTMELIISAIARKEEDLALYHRHVINKQGALTQPAYIPVGDVIYGATNTVARLIGAYFDLGMRSALVNPSIRREKIEDILRR